MEKIMYYLLGCLVAALTLSSCSDKSEEAVDSQTEYAIDVKADYAQGKVWVDDPSWFILLLSDVEAELEGGGILS